MFCPKVYCMYYMYKRPYKPITISYIHVQYPCSCIQKRNIKVLPAVLHSCVCSSSAIMLRCNFLAKKQRRLKRIALLDRRRYGNILIFFFRLITPSIQVSQTVQYVVLVGLKVAGCCAIIYRQITYCERLSTICRNLASSSNSFNDPCRAE